MKTWFSLLGREQDLAVAELAAVLPHATLVVRDGIAVGTGEAPDWTKLGGSQRAGVYLGECETGQPELVTALLAHIPLTDGKLKLGISLTGGHKPAYLKLWKAVKKSLRESGQSVRLVVSQTGTSLNAAEVSHNQLLGEKGLELVIWRSANGWQFGKTTWNQDIEAYTKRDRERPARDAWVGMLPPKLAQIMINLAQAPAGAIVYDPFCGTGVVLQEALLAGYRVGGSDISKEMVTATETNLAWLSQQHSFQPAQIGKIARIDARDLSLPVSPQVVVVAEGYLGRPQSETMQLAALQDERAEADDLYAAVLENLVRQTQLGGMVLALPFWHLDGRDYYLRIIDSLGEIGYTSDQFAPSGRRFLTYRRPEQRVGRMIIKLHRQ